MVTMDLKQTNNILLVVGKTEGDLPQFLKDNGSSQEKPAKLEEDQFRFDHNEDAMATERRSLVSTPGFCRNSLSCKTVVKDLPIYRQAIAEVSGHEPTVNAWAASPLVPLAVLRWVIVAT